MNTQLNSTQPAVTLDNINLEILTFISDRVQETVEDDPDYAQDLAKFNEAIAAVKGCIPHEMMYILENAPWSIATPIGTAMFLMGLRLGRDPMAILTLPEGKNIR